MPSEVESAGNHTLAPKFKRCSDRGNCFLGSAILGSLSTGPVLHAQLVYKRSIRLAYVKKVCVQKFRTNEQVFMVVSQTIPPSGPRVVQSVYQEWHIGLPAGFARPNRYAICNVILHVLTV